VGAYSPRVRALAGERLGFLGVDLDDARNRNVDGDADISATGASVRTFVVVAREEIEIARQVRAVTEPTAIRD
jgi:acetate kinase